MDFLGNLTSIGGWLHIFSNPVLENLYGLSGITDLSNGSLRVEGNNALTNVDGLRNVNGSLGGSLDISHNAGLAHIDGLSGINDLSNGSLRVVGNTALTNVDAPRRPRREPTTLLWPTFTGSVG